MTALQTNRLLDALSPAGCTSPANDVDRGRRASRVCLRYDFRYRQRRHRTCRRTTVVMAAGALQRSGMIIYSRCKVHILSPETLEAAACDCYKVVRQPYDGLYQGAI